jgi:hypothetical protein
LLVQVWMNCLPLEIDREQECILLSIVQVLRIYGKLESAKSLLIRYCQGAWLGRVLQYIVLSLDQPTGAVSPVTGEFLGLVKDLTFRSAAPDKEVLLHLEGGILQRFLFSCCDADVDANPKTMEWFTAVVWNLVLDKSICGQLLQSNLKIVRGLLKALSANDTSTEKQSTIHTKMKRNATSAIGNIVADTRNQKRMFTRDVGEEELEIIPVFMNLVEQDTDSVVRRRAMRTLRCLASSTEAPTKASIEKEEIVSFLVDTIARNVSQDDENDRDMQIQACQTVNALIESLEHGDWPRLETALLQRIETTTDPKLIQASCRCLIECVKKSPWRRGPSCFSEMCWKRLESATSISPDTHDSIGKLFLELAKREKQVESSTAGRPSTLTCPPIVNTLTVLLSQPGDPHEESRSNALEVVSLLVENEDNRRPLAENESLLSGLVNLCLLQPDKKSKDAAKQVILDLVPEL